MSEKVPVRCVNLDWLEVHCLEPVGQPRNADFFRTAGFVVHEREYGTRVFREMFTVDGMDGQPLLEIRRNPASQGLKGLFTPEDCHIRLHNRTCYFNDAAKCLTDFINTYGYTFRRIVRVDICMDFERFDSGDDPQAFLTRYIKHRYAKINQTNRTTHGIDRWAGCIDNSVSWGSPHSDIGTKMYNKTLELYNAHDGSYSKPYILWNWQEAGLIQDPIHCTAERKGQQKTITIWRVEFSIRSSVRNWFAIELNGIPKQYQSIRNDLSMYDGRDKLIVLFASLAQHYFRFKHFNGAKRKDRCDDKVLWNWQGVQLTYKVGREASLVSAQRNTKDPLVALINKLRYYQQTHSAREIHRACQILIEDMERNAVRAQMNSPWNYEDIRTLQLALQGKSGGDQRDVAVLMKEVKKLLNINDNTAVF